MTKDKAIKALVSSMRDVIESTSDGKYIALTKSEATKLTNLLEELSNPSQKGPIIDWLPIADAPAALKDGRRVLIWSERGDAVVGLWDDPSMRDGNGRGKCWVTDAQRFEVSEATHIAEINPPSV